MEWVVFSLPHSVVSQVLVETNRRNTPISFSASFVWFVYFVVQKNYSGLVSTLTNSSFPPPCGCGTRCPLQ